MKTQIRERQVDDKMIKRQGAIIDSMTPKERRNPDILNASRNKRIAAGRGQGQGPQQPAQAAPPDGRHDEDDGRRQGPRHAGALGNMFGIGGGMAGGMPQPTPEQIEAMQKQMGGGGMVRRWIAADAAGTRAGQGSRACRDSAPKGPGLPELGGFPVREEEMMFLRGPASSAVSRSESPPLSATKLKEQASCPSRSVWPVAARRSAPTTVSSWPMPARRAMAVSSRRSAPTTR